MPNISLMPLNKSNMVNGRAFNVKMCVLIMRIENEKNEIKNTFP